MNGSPDSDPRTAIAGEAALFDFLAVWSADRSAGKVRDVADYVARFPEIEAAIRAEFLADAASAEGRDVYQEPRMLGAYRLIRKLGSGGQGTVYLAEDTRLARRVAIKILAPELDFVSSDRVLRFRREVEILAQLDHPGICSVLEAATTDDLPYLVMPFVEGETLATWVSRARAEGAAPTRRSDQHRILRWVASLARTLQEAHDAGIVHRDIKPGNIVLSPHTIPVILDFGIAGHIDATGGAITKAGSLLGTLAYMAPETLHRRTSATDPRCDVYALGVTLYECLTHHLPFEAETYVALCRAIETGEAVDARQHNPSLPRDLEAVVMTAIAKSPVHRYQRAIDLADDLDRVMAREAIHARKLPAYIRALRVVQRHPTLCSILATVLIMLGALAYALREAHRNEREASALNRALSAGASDEGAFRALEELVEAAGPHPDSRMRSALLHALDGCHLAHSIARRSRYPSPILDHGKRHLAIGDQHGVLSIEDIASGKRTATRQASSSALRAMAFTRDGARIITTGDDGVLRVWSTENLSIEREIRDFGDAPLTTLGMNPAGTLLLAGGQGRVHAVDTETWKPSRSIEIEAAARPTKLLFSPDGEHVLVLAQDGSEDPDGANRAWIVGTKSATIASRIEITDQEVVHAQWHATKPALALAYNGGRIEVIDPSTGKRLFAKDTSQEAHWCGFDPGGEHILVPSDHATEVWRWGEPRTAPELSIEHPYLRTIGAAAWSNDGKMLAAVHRDGTIVVRDARSWSVLLSFQQRAIDVRYLAWSLDDAMLLTADFTKVSVWHVLVRPHMPRLFCGSSITNTLAAHPDGDLVLTGSREGQVVLRSLASGRVQRELASMNADVRRVRFDRRGQRAVAVAVDGSLAIFDLADGTVLQRIHAHEGAVVDAFFCDAVAADVRHAETLISIGDDGRLILHDIGDASARTVLQLSNAPLRCVTMHPTRPLVAVGHADRRVSVWNIALKTLQGEVSVSSVTGDWRINPMAQVRGICFEGSSNLLRTSLVNDYLHTIEVGDDGVTRISGKINDGRFGGPLAFDAATSSFIAADYSFGYLSKVSGEQLQPLMLSRGAEAHRNRVTAVAVHPRGELALSASQDGNLLAWDMNAAELRLSMRFDAALLDACFRGDGASILVSCFDGSIRSVPLDPLAVARDYIARRRQRME